MNKIGWNIDEWGNIIEVFEGDDSLEVTHTLEQAEEVEFLLKVQNTVNLNMTRHMAKLSSKIDNNEALLKQIEFWAKSMGFEAPENQ